MKKNINRLDRLPIGTRIVTIFCLAWAAFVALLPLIWLLISSFKEDPLARPGFQLPEAMYFEGYISTFRDLNVLQYFGNSMIISVISVVISILLIVIADAVMGKIFSVLYSFGG